MGSLLQRASVLAAALACITVNAYAEGPDKSEVRAFLDSVREFGQPGLQSDAGLLVYPADPRISSAPAQIVSVPYTGPTYVTNHVQSARRQATAPLWAYPPRVARNGGPSLAVQMQLQSQVVRPGNGGPSQALLMQHQQAMGTASVGRPNNWVQR